MALKAKRRDALVRAAIDVIAERGLGGTRVADIAERAGISPGHAERYVLADPHAPQPLAA